ncbi:MAG: hypothetical protein WC505_05665 [Patescibacteria group bacterium]
MCEKGSVWIGSDSCGSNGFNYTIRKDKKVFRRDNMIFGFTSSFRMGQLIQTSLVIPEHRESVDDFTYLTTLFIDSVMSCFRDKSFLRVKDNEAGGGTFLVGYRGNIYEVEADFQVGQPVEQYAACGCGLYFALGAMHALQKHKLAPKEKITRALAAAAGFAEAVRPPWNFVSLAGDKRNTGKPL